MAEFFNSAGKGMKGNIINMERGAIMEGFADKIDAAAMGLRSPYDIAFYPFGTLDHPRVGQLFNK